MSFDCTLLLFRKSKLKVICYNSVSMENITFEINLVAYIICLVLEVFFLDDLF